MIRSIQRWYRSAALAIVGLGLVTVQWYGCGGGYPVTAITEDESVTITGRVTAVDGSSVAGADVVLEPLSMATVTDAMGGFAFTVASSGEGASAYILEVRRDGYEIVSLQILVGPAGTADVHVTLQSIPPDPADPAPEPAPSGIVVTSTSDDEVLCIAAGVELPFTVRIANEGDAPVEGIVLHDTLDTGFSRILTSADIVVNRSTFPDAVLVLNSNGRSFRVELGPVPPMDPAEVYTVTLPASAAGVFCNRVSAVRESGALLSSDIGCVTNTLAIEIDLLNEDGAIVDGTFTPEPEMFHVGDGGPDRPDALVYRVVVANHHCGSLGLPMGDSSLTSIVGAHSGSVEFREVLPGFPSRGSVVSSSGSGLVWSIGSLAPGDEAEIRFRVEAMQAGEDVHRIELSVPQLTGTIINEEPIAILP